MNVLIIGGGGREHALAWKVAQSDRVKNVFVAPGNAGTALEAKVQNVPIAATDIADLLAFAQANHVGMTIVGPEAPLVLGVVDTFTAAGLRCFGPGRAAAQLEGSKSFAKDFLARHDIPTAAYRVFTEVEPALAYLAGRDLPIVIKADGLAAGKGVIIARTAGEAASTVRDMLAGNAFGEAGHRVVIEDFMAGEEASFIVLSDGGHVVPMATSQDHKARDNSDRGPNTGGLGSYSPAPVVTPEVHARVMEEIVLPTIRGMAAEGTPFVGFLYAGLMIGPDGAPRVVEFNCRFGDPECQPVMMRLRSDLVDLCETALDGRLDEIEADWDPRPALGVVMAAGGYPDSYRKGDAIVGLPTKPVADARFFHAGTALRDGRIVTSGGRVLCATALGETVLDAQIAAYNLAKRVHWDGLFYRTDIGYRAIARERERH